MVNYKLWPETFRLLKKLGNHKGEHVLLNLQGQPLRRWEGKQDGKTRNANAVLRAWQRLADATGIKKPLKLLRKTSASMLANHATFGQFAFLFLGHSPKTTAERHYVQVPQELFDEAIAWLCRSSASSKRQSPHRPENHLPVLSGRRDLPDARVSQQQPIHKLAIQVEEIAKLSPGMPSAPAI